MVLVGIASHYFFGASFAQSLPANCFPSPGSCGYPDPNYNGDSGSTAVGVADCAALPTFSTSNLPAGTYYGGSGQTLEITGNNVTINHLNMGNFTIYVSSGVNNFTFENSCISAGDGTDNSVGINIASGATNTLIKDSTISGTGTNIASFTTSSGTCTPGAGVSNGALGIAVDNNGTGTTIDGVYTYDVGSGAPGAGGGTSTTVENSYQLINTIPACEHDEPIYFSDATINIHNNVLLNEEDQTAAVFGNTFTSGGACDNNLTMTNNLIAGGDYVVYPCGNAGSAGTSTMDIQDNRFARCLTIPLVASNSECSGSGLNGGDAHGYYPNGGYYGVAGYYYTGTGQTWSGNYWDDNLDAVNIDGTSGAPVASPGPAVTITTPNSNTYASKTIAITATANATAPATVHDVQFQVDGTNIPGCDPASPATGSTYVCTGWDSSGVSDGTHTLKVIVTDSNGQTASSSEAVTTDNSDSGPLSIWSDAATPTNPDTTNDSGSINIGTKFQSSESGYILGVRFYKGTGNTGTHVGALWTSSGTLLASVTFTNETASGWQEAFFSSPVAITANTTYVISYYAPNGNYAADANYFAASGVTNGPLTALQNNDSNGDGGNGIYAYVAANSFPNQTYNAANYWVDPVFTTSQNTIPTVTMSSPASGASVNGITPITASIVENGGAAISNVRFQVDGSDIANCAPTSPISGSLYECSVWDTTGISNGTHAIQAVVTDANGNVTTSGETVTINNPTPTVSLAASPNSVASGSSSKLTWTSTNAASCTASGAWSGSQPLSNASGYTVTPSQTGSYTLTCSGSGGKASASVTITVIAASAPSNTASASSTPQTSSSQEASALTAAPTAQSTPSAAPQSSAPPQASPATPAPTAQDPQSTTQASQNNPFQIPLIPTLIIGAICIFGVGLSLYLRHS